MHIENQNKINMDILEKLKKDKSPNNLPGLLNVILIEGEYPAGVYCIG
jgi:hypothetical protein